MSDKFFAAADCGTNSFHMIIAEAREDGYFTIAAREREIVRLGKNKNNYISAEALGKSVKTLQQFRRIAESYNAPLAVVATSAVRNSRNKEEFLEKVKELTGISVRLLSGAEEAELTYRGVTLSVPSEKTMLCIDIGGGSTEFIIGKKGDILFSKSLELGAVTLSRKFFNEDYSYSGEHINEAYNFTENDILKIKSEIEKYNFEKVIGASGTIISAASMVTGGNPDLNHYHLKRTDIDALTERILKLKTVEERKRVPGLEPERADIIPAGLIILQVIYRLFDFDEIVISLFGLREGVIVDSFLSKH